jgi:putative heme-binding domain-containing protein
MPVWTFRSIAVLCVSWAWAGLAFGAGPTPGVVATWAAGPMEVRVAFDRAVDPELARRAVGEPIQFGEGEKPGVPGRAGGDRGTLRVAAASLVDDGRTLVLVTDPHPRETSYQLTLPGVKDPGKPGSGVPVELAYDLGGVEASYPLADGSKRSIWWPTVDPQEARKLSASSVGHQHFLEIQPGGVILTLQTLVSAPKGNVTLNLDASAPFEATFGQEVTKSAAASAGSHRAALKVESTGEAVFFSVDLPGVVVESLKVRAAIGPEPLPRSAFILPWAPPKPEPSLPTEVPANLMVGGDPVRGEVVFLGEQAKCGNCHKVGGKGGIVGPDLTNLAGRDRAWVWRNINEPSTSIHPEYVSYTVTLKDGRVATGVVRAEGAHAIKVGDNEAKQTIFPRAEIEEIRPSPSSIMPVGLLGVIGDDQTRDLLAYLTARK